MGSHARMIVESCKLADHFEGPRLAELTHSIWSGIAIPLQNRRTASDRRKSLWGADFLGREQFHKLLP